MLLNKIPDTLLRSQLDDEFYSNLLNYGVDPLYLFDKYGALLLVRYAAGSFLDITAAATYRENTVPSKILNEQNPPLSSSISPTEIANAFNFADGLGNLQNLNGQSNEGVYQSYSYALLRGGNTPINANTNSTNPTVITSAWNNSVDWTNFEILTDDRMMMENSKTLKVLPIWELIPDTYADRREQIRAVFNELAKDLTQSFFDSFIYSSANIPQKAEMPKPDVNGYTLISTAEQLNAIRSNTTTLSGKYVLVNDIDLSAWGSWTPISTFTGIFDGNGNTVRNVKIAAGNANPGLFGVVSNTGMVKNLAVTYATRAGGIAGINNGSITNCYFTWDFVPVRTYDTAAMLPNVVRITENQVIVDISSLAADELNGRTITVADSVETIKFKGFEGRTYTGLNIVVEGNTDVILENFWLEGFTTTKTTKAVDFYNLLTFKMETITITTATYSAILPAITLMGMNPSIISTGFSNYITGGGNYNAIDGNGNLYICGNADITICHFSFPISTSFITGSEPGSSGKNAIQIGGTLDIAIDAKLTATGGDGISGSDGVDGSSGKSNATVPLPAANGTPSKTEFSDICGKAGLDGVAGTAGSAGTNGGIGGDGGNGISALSVNIRNTSNVLIQSGAGGNGGNGGKGGKGGSSGHGQAGGDGVYLDWSSGLFSAYWGGDGGSGGYGASGASGQAGGNGGTGGKGGSPLVSTTGVTLAQSSLTRSSTSVLTIEAGMGGNGGTGGDGGNGGAGGNGGNGGERGSGKYGTGGKTREGYHGRDGGGGSGGASGNGGIGGVGGANGALVTISGSNDYNPASSIGALGGKAGTVGSGGYRGQTYRSPVFGTHGKDGAPGNQGTDRSSTRAANGTQTYLTRTIGTATSSNTLSWTSARIEVSEVKKLTYEPNELFYIDDNVTLKLVNAGTSSGAMASKDIGVYYDFSVPGNTVVTITYDSPAGKVVRYIPVKVLPPTVKEVALAIPQNTFYVDEAFSADGIACDVYFTNGDLVTLQSNISVDFPPDITESSGRKEVTVTCQDSVEYMNEIHSLSAFNPMHYFVNVFDVGLEWLEIIKGPNVITYFEGESFDPTGMEFRAHNNNGSVSYPALESMRFYPPVGSVFECADSAYPIEAEFGYEDETIIVVFQVSVNADPIDALVIRRNPDKTLYIDGDTFNPEGLEAFARRQNSRRFTTEEPLKLGELDWFRGYLRELDHEIDVIYRTGVGFFTAPVSVSVIPVKQVGIEIAKLPDKSYYIEGQSFDPSGMIVDRIYNNGGRDQDISGYNLSHGKLNIGDAAVTILEGDFSTSIPVYVNEKSVVNLEIIQGPDITEYLEGNFFNAAGMVLKATYNNGDVSEDVKGYGITPDRPLLVGDTAINIYFGGLSETIFITVTEIKPTGVTLNKSSLALTVGNAAYLSETVSPENALNMAVTWESSNPSVASVDEYGFVVANTVGSTIIKATTVEGGLTAECVVNVIADTAPLLSVSSVAYLSGKQVDVTIDLANNPGFAGMALKVSFPNELTLTRYMIGDMDVLNGFTGPDGVAPGASCSISDNFYLVWGRSSEYAQDGTLVTLTFTIAQEADPGGYPIIVAFEQHDGPRMPVDLQGNPLTIYVRDGSVIALSHILGSVTDNGEVGPADLVRLARWIANHNVTINELAADITGAGEIGPADLVRLARWIAGHFGRLTLEQVQLWQQEYSYLTLEQMENMFYPVPVIDTSEGGE